MQYKIKIYSVQEERDGIYNQELSCFDISSQDEAIDNMINLYHDSQNFGKLFRELISFLEPSSLNYQDYENLDQEALKVKLRATLERCTNLELVNSDLQKQVSDLSETKLGKEKDEVNDQLIQAEDLVKSKDQLISELEKKLETEKLYNNNLDHKQKSLQEELKKYQKKSENLESDGNHLVQENNSWGGQVGNLFPLNQENTLPYQQNNNLNQKIDRLEESKGATEEQKLSIDKELKETQRKLNIAMARLHGQTEKSGIAGGGSRSDKLKNDFNNLKMGLFREASSKVLNCWKEKDSTLTFRSEEFSKIRSVLSQHVFIDGMSYFAEDKSEIKNNIRLIVNEMILIEGLNPTQLILQAIEQKIEAVLLQSKGIDSSKKSLTSNVEATTKKIVEDLHKIIDFDLSEDALREIKKFVGAGLKLAREIVNDTDSGEFYTPEIGEKFKESLHDTRDKPGERIKLTIYPGYRIPGNILVKADVVTIFETLVITDKTNTTNVSGEIERQKTSDVSSTLNIASDESKIPKLPDKYETSVTYDENEFEEDIYNVSFTGIVASILGVKCYTKPRSDQEYFGGLRLDSGTKVNFDAWIYSDEIKDILTLDKSDGRWYKISGYELWVSAVDIEGEPPNSFPSNEEGS